MREFDLNIEKVLENWNVSHAVREVIANALDEQILTNSKDIEIYKDADDIWHIRDYGRGIQYHHLTQNENEEKHIYNYTNKILETTNTDIKPSQIFISNCLQPDFPEESFGVIWEPFKERIIIHRKMLKDISTYAGVLIHEITHADTGLSDVSRSFETALTRWIGYFAALTII